MDEILHSYFVEFGRKGGKSKSEKKLKAIAENLKKAHEATRKAHHLRKEQEQDNGRQSSDTAV